MTPSSARRYDAGRLDRLLDRSVALGYANIGYAIRSRSWEEPGVPGALAGKHVLITGATSGIGRAAAAACAAYGATVHVLGHNPERREEALAWLRARVPQGDVVGELCDLQSLAEVQAFGRRFAERVPRLYALVHNAGVMSHQREETVDGHERTLAVHVLAAHALNRQLGACLAAEGRARVVFMSSGGMYASPLPAHDLEYRLARYTGSQAYARTKRMQVVLAEEWAERLAADGTAVHAMHPGWVDTSGVRTYLPRFRFLTRPFIRSPEQGADTLVWLLTQPRVQPWTGGFWHDRAPRPTHYRASTRETEQDRRALWAHCEAATAPWTSTKGPS